MLLAIDIDLSTGTGPNFILRVDSANPAQAEVWDEGTSAKLAASNYTLASEGVVKITGKDGTENELTIDFVNGNPFPQGASAKVQFKGENPGSAPDKLKVKKGDFTSVTITYTGSTGTFPSVPGNEGKILLDGDVLEFAGLASVVGASEASLYFTQDTSIESLVFNLPSGVYAAEIVDNATAGDGVSQITIPKLQSPSLASAEFANPTENLHVNLGRNANMISIAELDSLFAPRAGFLVVGGAASDTFNVTSPQSLTIAGGAGSDRLVVTDDGIGDVTLIRKNPDGQSGSVLVAPAATAPLGPVVFEAVEYVTVTPIDSVSGGTGSDSNGRVVELDADPLEMNNTRQNATPYGLLSQLDVQPAIDPDGDEDWYSFAASSDSSYRFALTYDQIDDPMSNGQPGLPDNGELQFSVYTSTGTLVSSGTAVTGGKAVVLSLEHGKTYYVRVRGVGDAVNLYDLEITDTRDDGTGGQFEFLSGSWTVDREGLNSCYRGASDPLDNAVAVYTGALPVNNANKVIEVTINAEEIVAGPRWSNAFVIFDFDPANLSDFKFAGAFVGIDKWVIGHSAANANGYLPDKWVGGRIDANTDYRIRIEFDTTTSAGNTIVKLSVHDGHQWNLKASYQYTGLFAHDSVGLLTMRGIAWFDDFADPDTGTPDDDTDAGSTDDGTGTTDHNTGTDSTHDDADTNDDDEKPEPVVTNSAPVARSDRGTTSVGQAITINVLANDSDADGDSLVVSLVAQAAHGTATLTADRSFLYTPDSAFAGADCFTYRVNDGQASSAVATVSIVVDSPNSAPIATEDAATTREDAAVTIDVLANDCDADADSLAVVSFTQGAHGSVVKTTGGELRYTPQPDFDQADSFTYRVSDGRGGTALATVQVVVTPVNDPPVAAADAARTEEAAPVTIDVLANDSDPDGDDFSVVSVAGGVHGSVTSNAGQSVTYVPQAGYRGPDSFAYTIGDSSGATATGQVTVQIGSLCLKEEFDGNQTGKWSPQAGKWSISGNRYLAQAQHVAQNAVSLLQFDDVLPTDLQARVTFNTDPITSTRWSNAFIVFDYKSTTDYKFAGAFVGIDHWAIGRMTPQGYVMDRSIREPINSGTDYQMELVLEGSRATLKAGGVVKVSCTYADSLQDGQLGLSTFRGNARFDNLTVQEL